MVLRIGGNGATPLGLLSIFFDNLASVGELVGTCIGDFVGVLDDFLGDFFVGVFEFLLKEDLVGVSPDVFIGVFVGVVSGVTYGVRDGECDGVRKGTLAISPDSDTLSRLGTLCSDLDITGLAAIVVVAVVMAAGVTAISVGVVITRFCLVLGTVLNLKHIYYSNCI